MHDDRADEPSDYRVEHVRAALAADPRVQEPELGVEIVGGRVLVTGIVATEERRRAVDVVAREVCPDLEPDNRVAVVAYPEPRASERIE